MRAKKIIVFHSSSDLYGASNSLVRSLKAMLQTGFQPLLILSGPGHLGEVVGALGVEVRYIRLGVLRRKYFSLKGMLNRLFYTGKAVAQIRKIILTEGFEMAMTNTVVVYSGAIAARLAGVAHVWHVRETVSEPSYLKKFITQMLIRTGDSLFFVSNACRDNYMPELRAVPSEVIYNGIDPMPFMGAACDLKGQLGIPKDHLVLFMVGRVSVLKGQLYFLEIARRLMTRNAHLHFVMAGDVYPGNESLMDEIRDYISEHELQAYVTDLGFRNDVPEIITGVDIFLLPSIQPDSLPTTVLEAMAAAKPVVATNTGGAGEMVIEGKTGFLMPNDDAQAAADLVQRLIDDPLLRENMGREGRSRLLGQFSMEGYLNALGAALNRVWEEHRKKPGV